MLPIVAIVGRPNVGKSTLFNRLVGERRAIVHDRPGVTRDRHYDTTERWGSRELVVIDTGGFEPDPEDDLFDTVRDQAMAAVEEADVVVFVSDVRAGVTPMDIEAARLLRAADRPVLLAVNKVEGRAQEAAVHEFYSLGVPELFPISAEHGVGVLDLMERVLELLPPASEGDAEVPDEGALDSPAASDADRPELRIAIIGRPNIGKSTLVNRLLGEDRHVVHDRPGTTMDAIDSTVERDGRRYLLVDTAGVRRRARVSDALEGFAVSRAIRSIERCHVTLLMIDGTLGPTEQDARLARLVVDRGRALIVLINKWDLVRKSEGGATAGAAAVREALARRLPHADWAPVLLISALTGRGVHRLFERIESVYASFDTRLSTSDCNRFLQHAVLAHSVPQRHHRPVRLNYMTQVRVRPPTFTVFCNTPEGVAEPYKRYLKNRLRGAFSFEGTPIRVQFKRKRRRDRPPEPTDR